MLYSGADLIRTSGQQQARLNRLATSDDEGVRAVDPVQRANTPTEGDTQGALLRFARFIHKEGEKKKRPRENSPTTVAVAAAVRAGDPYRQNEVHQQNLFERGQQLDVYI